MTFEEKQELVFGLHDAAAYLLEWKGVFLFGNCDNWAKNNLEDHLRRVVEIAARFGITYNEKNDGV